MGLELRRGGLPLACLAGILLRLTDRQAGLVLVYHGVEERQGDPAREIVAPHGIDLFERQLRHLRRWYRVVGSDEILDAVQARRRGGRFPVAITFDDDLRSHARNSLPVLDRLGLRATFFVCGASLETPFSFWWERLQRALDVDDGRLPAVLPESASASGRELAERVKLLDPAERDRLADALASDTGLLSDSPGMPAADILLLVERGMRIGFHTRRHDPLDRLDDDRLAAAMREGRNELEVLAGAPLEEIAYPHGAQDERVAGAARRAGFHTGFSVDGRAVSSRDDRLLIPRVVTTYGSGGQFALQLYRKLRSP